MAIPLSLLRLTEGRAPGIATYGGPATFKTGAFATFPAPGLALDLEGGCGSLLPWARCSRKWDSTETIFYTQGDREAAWNLLDPGLQAISPLKRPAPRVDIISFDPSNPRSYDAWVQTVATFNPDNYNSLMVDPLQEFGFLFQAFSKKQQIPGWDNLTAEQRQAITDKPMEGKLWHGVQERCMIQFKNIRALQQKGVFVYFTAGQAVDKDYVKPPQSQGAGEKEEPYAQKGSVWINGKMVDTVTHGVDILIRAKAGTTPLPTGGIVSAPVWMTVPEPFAGGSGVYWDAKDRYGRLPDILTVTAKGGYIAPNFQVILSKLYGVDGAKAIYKAVKADEETAANAAS